VIVETRQNSDTTEKSFDEMWLPCGILNVPAPEPYFHIEHLLPSSPLSSLIENYWSINWDLDGGKVRIQEMLPYPNVHVVFEEDGGIIFGVASGKFERRLQGTSRVFGVRFAPGMFRAYFGKSVALLADTSIPVRQVFGEDVRRLESALKSAPTDSDRVCIADQFFLSRFPKPDKKAALARALVLHAREVREVVQVEQLAEAFKLSLRTMQRVFADYVGISPKWVIRRFRLQEAITRLRSEPKPDFARLALTLGYYDQAHLINDFKSILGCTPLDFQRAFSAPQ
jgi:AraC-like DNA-binding protein